MTKTTKSLYVISSYTVAGEDEIGSGGFAWLPENTTFSTALAHYYNEVEVWKGGDVVVRLVRLNDVPADLDGADLTDYIDAERLDEIERNIVPLATTRVSTATEAYIY